MNGLRRYLLFLFNIWLPISGETAVQTATSVCQFVCPKGQLGEFKHGSKCIGYYNAEKKLVDIELRGIDSSKDYSFTKDLVHAGIDIVADAGSEVFPVSSGTVAFVVSNTNDEQYKWSGFMVIVRHDQQFNGKDTFSLYLHMKQPPQVSVGDRVVAGNTVLGEIGNTGAAFGFHTHFEIRHFKEPLFIQWGNIYGKERVPAPDKATFNEAAFQQMWEDPEKFPFEIATISNPSVTTPISHKNYNFYPGKLTGKQFLAEDVEEKKQIQWREFCFDPSIDYKKPEETTSVKLSLRGGYSSRNLFGHFDFEQNVALEVATGWLPQASGGFIVFPDLSNDHLPKWEPNKRTYLFKVPFVERYGEKTVNAYDIALGLNQVNSGQLKTIPFKKSPITADNGRRGVRLNPTLPLAVGVYFAYSLPDASDTDIYGFLFAVGNPASSPPTPTANPTLTATSSKPSGPGNSTPAQTPPTTVPAGDSQTGSEQASTFLKFPIDDGLGDPWDAKISALMDHDLKKDGKLKTFRGEGVNVTHITVGENGKELSEGEDYFVINNGEDFDLGDLSSYNNGLKGRFNYDGHHGIDFAYVQKNKVIAAADGELFIPGMEKNKAYHAIAIKHDNGFVTYYLHLSKWDPKIEEYYNDPAKQKSRIKKGEVIGNPGSWGPPGSHYGVHLHFGVHNANDVSVDPYGEFINGVQTAPVLWERSPIK